MFSSQRLVSEISEAVCCHTAHKTFFLWPFQPLQVATLKKINFKLSFASFASLLF